MVEINNNKGFSLVELLVSVAILCLVAIATLGFLVSGSRSYSSVSSSVNLQSKSQFTMNYIQEYLIDCNEGVYFSDSSDTLYIIDSEMTTDPITGDTEKTYSAHIFKYDSSEQSIYYGNNTATVVNTDQLNCSGATPDLLADGVSSFSVALSGGTQLSEATVTIDFFVMSKTFTGIQTIALRNNPSQVTVTPVGP